MNPVPQYQCLQKDIFLKYRNLLHSSTYFVSSTMFGRNRPQDAPSSASHTLQPLFQSQPPEPPSPPPSASRKSQHRVAKVAPVLPPPPPAGAPTFVCTITPRGRPRRHPACLPYALPRTDLSRGLLLGREHVALSEATPASGLRRSSRVPGVT